MFLNMTFTVLSFMLATGHKQDLDPNMSHWSLPPKPDSKNGNWNHLAYRHSIYSRSMEFEGSCYNLVRQVWRYYTWWVGGLVADPSMMMRQAQIIVRLSYSSEPMSSTQVHYSRTQLNDRDQQPTLVEGKLSRTWQDVKSVSDDSCECTGTKMTTRDYPRSAQVGVKVGYTFVVEVFTLLVKGCAEGKYLEVEERP